MKEKISNETASEGYFVQRENDRKQIQRPSFGQSFRPGKEGYAEIMEAMKMAKQYMENKEQGR